MYKQTTAPDAGYQFHRWQRPIPPLTQAEIRLAQLRQIHGNAEGTRIYRAECRIDAVRL